MKIRCFLVTINIVFGMLGFASAQNMDFKTKTEPVNRKVDSLLSVKNTTANPVFSRLGKANKNSGFTMKGYWVWDGCAVKGDDDKYHMFCSRWPDSLLMHPGWMASSEIIHCVAGNAEGPYEFQNVVFSARGAQYWDGRSTFNPQVFKHKGKYYMFYVGSTHPFEEPTAKAFDLKSKWCIVGRSNKRVGLAVAENVNGPWKRFDKPIIETEPNTFYSFLTSNPTPVIHEDGSVLVIFKARSYIGNVHSGMSLGVAYAKKIEGPYTVLNNKKPVFDYKNCGEQEDPFMWKDKTGYHLVFKDQVAQFTGERGAGVLSHSTDGVHWKLDKEPKAWSKAIEWSDGTKQIMGQLERPFIMFENNKPAYIFFSTMDGIGGFENGSYAKVIVIPFKN
ncbi:MAG: glycoside hydrolase family protein [Prolixibacteraceae bacterium]